MLLKGVFAAGLFFALTLNSTAQYNTDVHALSTTALNRNKLYTAIIRSINNLSVPLNSDTEEKWSNAFYGIELIGHTSPWEKNRIHYAFDSIAYRSISFQRDLLELVYSNYPTGFDEEISSLSICTTNEKVFAMCMEYLLRNHPDNSHRLGYSTLTKNKFTNINHPIIHGWLAHLQETKISVMPIFCELLSPDFLPGNVIMYSIQRKDRNYPGIVLIRDSSGNFIRKGGKLFSVPQLARSLSDLPGYLTDGSTPQGIFRMHGFAVSESQFIGPTTNIQLTMPGELGLVSFLRSSTIRDSVWTEKWYSTLLQGHLKEYAPLYQSYYAGMAGRTEIIAHGTTVDPKYYSSKTYFPFTPTEGCLCTKEFWDPVDGRQTFSDQQLLVNAIKSAGGAEGYCVVIELNDKKEPVHIEEIAQFLTVKK